MLPLRLVSWNLCNCGAPGYGALARVINHLNPDILLAQECGNPALYKGIDGYQTVWRPLYHNRWGSAILVRKEVDVEAIPLPLPDFEGSVVGARITWEGSVLNIFSVHTPTNTTSYPLLANRIIQGLAGQIEGQAAILGGDWNCTISQPTPGDSVREFAGSGLPRKTIEELKLRNAWQAANPGVALARTYRSHQYKDKVYHIDGFLLTPALDEAVIRCEVLENEPWLDSDHNPVVLELLR